MNSASNLNNKSYVVSNKNELRKQRGNIYYKFLQSRNWSYGRAISALKKLKVFKKMYSSKPTQIMFVTQYALYIKI